MVLAPANPNGGGSGGGEAIPAKVTETVEQIKEIVCDYSEGEIYAMLKESGMDPNETTQKLLSQDPFHEVKRKRDKKKEQAGHRVITDTRNPMEHNVHWAKPPEQNMHWAKPPEQNMHWAKPPEQNMHWAKPPTNWDRNARRGGYNRVPTPGFREFRIVRDNRAINSDAKPETPQLQAYGSQQAQITIPVKNSAEVLTKQKQSHATNPKRYTQGVKELPVAGPPGVKNPGLNGSKKPLLPEESQTTVSGPTQKVQREANNSSNAHAATTSTNSVIGVYSSSSDPVHVPSPDSRTAGTAGAIRREVGVVGVRRQQSSDRSATHTVVSHKTDSVSSLRKDVALSPAESLRNTSSLSKSSQLNQPSTPSSNMASISNRPNNQHNNKLHQQTAGQQKAVARSMEWKPKPSKKSNVISPNVDAVTSCPDNSTSTSTVDATSLSEKLSQVNVVEKEHVIIPQHLRVPESERTNLTFGSFGDGFERTKLTFGSFGDGFDSSKAFTSAYQATETIDSMNDEPSMSVSTLVTAGSGENASAINHGDFVDAQESDSPASEVESEQPPSGNNDSFSENVDNYAEIGLVQSHSPPFSSSQPPQLHNASALPSYVAYNNQTSYDVPFFRNVMDDSIRGQVLSSSSEVLSSHAAISSPPASAAVIQHQSLQQQQTVPQMYPQLQISHFPNFMQYRQMISPVYLPQMALQNYPSTPSYPHPSNGSSYLLMPGASPHLTAGGIKYATSQYKPVPAGTPAGYGNFTNPAGFTINAPASIGSATGLEDVTRIKYKDNNLYVPNAQQTESTDIWIQTPREVPGLQSAQYYNLPGQAAHPTFMPTHVPTHAGLGSFNASGQSSHVQYPGLYHPTQPGSIPNTHHMVHQQVAPGFGQGVGVGVAGPGPQVGTYQQPQVSHLNWTGNF